MVMHMLRAGGVPLLHDPGYEASCETAYVLQLPEYWDWIPDKAKGKAVKFLEPYRYQPPRAMAYDFIYCMRNPFEQAKSQIKFLKDRGEKIHDTPLSVQVVADKLMEANALTLKFLKEYKQSRMFVMQFDNAITSPKETGAAIAEFLGLDTGSAMADAIHDREPACLEHMAEPEIVSEVQAGAKLQGILRNNGVLS